MGRACPRLGPRRALGGRKDRQSCLFVPSRCKSIKTCCITARLLTFTRVALAKSWQQISAGGEWHALSKLGTLVFHCLGTGVLQSPSQPPRTRHAPRWMGRPRGGICSLPEQGQLIRCMVRENSVLSVLIPPPFLWQWHRG